VFGRILQETSLMPNFILQLSVVPLCSFLLAQKRTGATPRKKGSQRRTVKNPNASRLKACAGPPDFWVNALLIAK
jgi:hypothetical protein